MGAKTVQPRPSSGIWALVRMQHGVVSRRQLIEQGLSSRAVEHRIANGRLHPIHRGVYAVGRPQLTHRGRWMAAVLRCGSGAALSHESAAALWQVRRQGEGPVEISVPAASCPRPPGIRVHRRVGLGPDDLRICSGIPLTRPTRTLIDLATRLPPWELEAAVNEADKRGLVDPETLRSALGRLTGQPGAGVLRAVLDRRTFVLTDSELERRFLPIVRRAGLPLPVTGRYVNGFKVDFFWPSLGLVVETDGLRYHRTPAQQARDRLRDQTHAAAGLTPLRFSHAQVELEPGRVEATLANVARRLAGGGAMPSL